MRQPKKIDKVSITLSDGIERHLYYTFEAAELIERANEQNLPKTRQMIVMLQAGLMHESPELTVHEVARLCEMANADYYDACIGEALLRQQTNPTQPAELPGESERGSGTNWYELITFSRLHFGVGEAEFWGLTPRLFYEMAEQHRRRNEHWEGVIGQIALMLYSAHKKEAAPDMTLRDFMPSSRQPAQPQPQAVQYATISDLDAFLKGTRRR